MRGSPKTADERVILPMLATIFHTLQLPYYSSSPSSRPSVMVSRIPGQTEIRRYEFQNRKFDSPVEIPKISKFLLNFDSSNFRKVFLCRISNGITTTANVTAILLSEFHRNFDSSVTSMRTSTVERNFLFHRRVKDLVQLIIKGSPFAT